MIQRANVVPIGRPKAPPPALRHGLLLFAVAFALRAAYAMVAAGPHATPASDSAEYDAVAWNLARGAGFSFGEGSGAWPTAFVPPVLPWLVSLLYRAVGHDYFGALLLQCAIGALVPLLLVALGDALYGGGIGRVAGWHSAFHPLLVFFSGYLLTETTFCVTLLMALTAAAVWIKTPRPGRAFGTGLLCGVAALTRPPALLLPVLLTAWAWAPLGLTLAARDRVRQCALLFLGLALAVGPWTLRNATVFHAFVPVTTGAGRALLDSNNPVLWSDPARRGGTNISFSFEPWATAVRGRTEVQADAYGREQAFAFLRGHVREWPAMALAKLGRFWRITAEGGGTGHWQREGSLLARWAGSVDPLRIWSLAVLPFALWGLARTLRGPRRWFQSLSMWVILYFTLGALMFWGALRMRLPIEPLVVLLAAVGFDDVRRRLRGRSHGLRVVEGRRKTG